MNHTLISQILGLSSQLIPSGGITGQVLTKNSNTNYDVSWQTISSVGTSGEPIFLGSASYNITPTNITNWNLAYSWGNSATKGYLTTETDPIFIASPSYSITSTEITHWNTAYGWGNWATQGFLTTETDPIFLVSPAHTITNTNITNWGTAYTDAHVHNNFGLLQTIINTGDGTKALMDNGTYQTVLSGVGGSTTQIQYNNSGALAGVSTLTYNSSTDTTSLTNILATTQVQVGNSSTYLSKDGSGNLTLSDAIAGSHTLAALAGSTTNYWTIVTGGINYTGNVGINSPSTLTDTLTVAGTIGAVNFDTSYFQYTSFNNLLLGPNSGTQDTGNNKLYIANNNTSSPLIYGEFNNQVLKFYASTFIGTGFTLSFSNATVNISNTSTNNLTFQDAVANSGSPVTLTSLINGTYNALKSDFSSYSTVITITASNTSTWNKASVLSTSGASTNYLGQDGNYHAVSTGSMTNPMTTVGDIIIGGTSGTPARLGIGTTGQYLTVVSGNPSWTTFPLLGRTESSGLVNTSIGYNSLPIGTTGGNNVALGNNSLHSNSSGYYNTAIGSYSLSINTAGFANTSIGINSLSSNSLGCYNLGIGPYSLGNNTSGNYNYALGYQSLYSCIVGNSNIAIGFGSGYNEIGSNQFYINNVAESSLSNDRAYSLLWGTFSGTSGSLTGQQLTVNGVLNINGSINLNGVPVTTGGGSMTWPLGGAGIPNYSGSSSWGTSYTVSGSNTVLLSTNGNGSLLTGITPSQISAEPALGNPSTNGYVLSSTTGGVRSWIANGTGGGSVSSGSLLMASGSTLIPYTTQTSGAFDSSTSNPSHYTYHLNYDGVFNVTNLVVNGTNASGISNGISSWGSSTGIIGNSISGTGVYGFSTSGPGVNGTSSTQQGILGVSSSGTGVWAQSITGTSLFVYNTGTVSTTAPMLVIQRSNTGTGYTSGDIINIQDTPTTSGTVSGNLLYASFGSGTGTVRTQFNPRVSTSGSAVAYMFDTVNNLSTTGDLLVSYKNQGTEVNAIDNNGWVYIGNHTVNGCWRMRVNGTYLQFDRLEAGIWVMKSQIIP